MARSRSVRPGAAEHRPIRPMLLAGGLGLLWFVQFQESGSAEDGPFWLMVLVLGVRLLADFVGAWVVVSALRVAFAFSKLGLMQLRAGIERVTR